MRFEIVENGVFKLISQVFNDSKTGVLFPRPRVRYCDVILRVRGSVFPVICLVTLNLTASECAEI